MTSIIKKIVQKADILEQELELNSSNLAKIFATENFKQAWIEMNNEEIKTGGFKNLDYRDCLAKMSMFNKKIKE